MHERRSARASMRATFSRIDTLTIASVLPGVGEHYLFTWSWMECRNPQPDAGYVKLPVRKTLKIKGLFHNSSISIILSSAILSINLLYGSMPARVGLLSTTMRYVAFSVVIFSLCIYSGFSSPFAPLNTPISM
jgi:uncharacterized membrane protein